jgi:hypothetical protein
LRFPERQELVGLARQATGLAFESLRFQTDVADAADQVVGGAFALCQGYYFDGRRLVVGAENELISGDFYVSYRASIVFQNSVHIEFAFAIWLK